jgi:hypothetical protein
MARHEERKAMYVYDTTKDTTQLLVQINFCAPRLVALTYHVRSSK